MIECSTCRFFKLRDSDDSQSDKGYCTRYPPKIFGKDVLAAARFPIVYGRLSCGEYVGPFCPSELLPDPDKLELLADWFDEYDQRRGDSPGGDVATDLRQWAKNSRNAQTEGKSE